MKKEPDNDQPDERRKEADQAERTIENSVEDFEETTAQISEEIGKKEEALRREVNDTNALMTTIKGELDDNANNLREGVANSIRWVVTRVEDQELASYLIAVVFSIGYLVAILYYSVPLNLESLSPLVVSLAIAILAGYSARRAKQDLTGGSFTITQYISSTFSSISSLAGRRLRTHESFDGVDQGLRTATSAAKRVLTSTKAFNPALKAVYQQATTEFQQAAFVRTITNALRYHGVVIASDAEALLRSFTSLSNTEDEWLAEISTVLAEKLGLTASIIALFYYTYADKAEGARNEWQNIRADQAEVAILTRTLLAGGRSGYLDGSDPKVTQLGARLLLNQQVFEPWAFYQALNGFQIELRAYEESVVQALTHFGFSVESSQHRGLYEFVPGSVDSDRWKKEFLDFAVKLFKISDLTLLLFVNESSGNSAGAQQVLAKIRQSPKAMDELLTVLTTNKVLKIPDRYGNSIDEVHKIVSNQISGRNFVSIETISSGLSRYFDSLDGGKQSFLQAMTSHNVKISETDRDQFVKDYLPLAVNLPDMMRYFAEKLGLKKEFLALLYYESIQDEASLGSTYATITSEGELTELANMLINLGYIEIPADSTPEAEALNLTSILKSFQTFNLSSIQARYQLFRNLLVWSNNLFQFSAQHEISPKRFLVDFPSLLVLLKGRSNLRSYQQLLLVARQIVGDSEIGSNGESATRAAALSILSIFFSSSDDPRKSEACKDLASDDLASKMVYRFIALTEEAQLRRSKVVLREVVQEILTNAAVQFPYLEDARSVFSEGRLPPSISDIANVRFGRQLRSIEDLTKRSADVSKMFDEMKASLHHFFGVKLEKDVVFQLLKLQVVSAYLVTTPSRKPVIGQIIDELMPQVCEELAKSDPSYRNMLMLERGAGNYTRIGIVPIGESFEHFNVRFTEVFHTTVLRYCERNPGENPADFSANLIRIFPVDATFKIMIGDPSVDETTDHPALRIRDLFLSRLTNEENLALVAASRVDDPERVALMNVIINLFDGYTSLWSLLESRISPIVGSRRQLREAFENRVFDKQFLQRFGSNTMTGLTIKIYAISQNPKGEREVKGQIRTQVTDMLRSLESRMSESEKETLADEIFGRLYNIGLILNSEASSVDIRRAEQHELLE